MQKLADPILITSSDLEQLRWRMALFERVYRELFSRFMEPLCSSLLDLELFRGIHSGKRCFVLGNGPSLNQIEMDRLGSEITFGANRVFLGFRDWGFKVTYWAVQDETQIRQSASEYVERLPAETIKFVPRVLLHLFDLDRFSNCCPVPLELHPVPYPRFSSDSRIQYNGWTVTYLLLQLAVLMGCNPIVLVGVDHSYSIGSKELVSPGRWKDPDSKSHFHPDYATPTENHVWNLPRFDMMDAAYRCAAEWASRNGVEILNASPGSKLDAFPHIEFPSLF